jgi:uncharacterized protein
MLWRLMLVIGLFYGVSFIFQIVLGVVVAVMAVSAGDDLSTANSVQAAITNNPLILPLSSLGSLLAIGLAFRVASRRVDHRSWADFGFHFNRSWWRDFAFGLSLGALLMGLIFLVEWVAGWVTITGILQTRSTHPSLLAGFLLSAVAFFCVGVYEEMLLRGYLLRNLAEGLQGKPFNPKIALLTAYALSSMVFGALHIANPNSTAASTVSIMVAGLFLGLGYLLTGELAISIGLHMTWNFFQGNVFGFPVSGMTINPSFIALQQRGPEAVTGGAFGPEAGLIGLGAIGLGSLLILLWVRWTRGSLRLEERLAVYRTPTLSGETFPLASPPQTDQNLL